MTAHAYLAGNWAEISGHAVNALDKLVPAHAPLEALKEAKVCRSYVDLVTYAPPAGHPAHGPARPRPTGRRLAQGLCHARGPTRAHHRCAALLQCARILQHQRCGCRVCHRYEACSFGIRLTNHIPGSAESESITLLYSKAAVEELTGSRFDLKVSSVSHDNEYGSAPISNQVKHTEVHRVYTVACTLLSHHTQPSAAKQLAKQVLDIDNNTDEVTSQRVYSEHFTVAHGKIKNFSLSAEFYKQSRLVEGCPP